MTNLCPRCKKEIPSDRTHRWLSKDDGPCQIVGRHDPNIRYGYSYAEDDMESLADGEMGWRAAPSKRFILKLSDKIVVDPKALVFGNECVEDYIRGLVQQMLEEKKQ